MKFFFKTHTVAFFAATGLLFSLGCSGDASQVNSSEDSGTATSSMEGPAQATSSMKFDVAGKTKAIKPQSAILKAVASVLVDAKGESVDAAEIGKAPYLLFYYSAHWCPPCRIFTPKLVEFYNANGGGDKFEIIFVSSDRSEKAMYDYMEEEKMPWAAIKYDAIGSTGIKDHSGPYIPSLVMFDSEGNLVIGTDYDGGVEPTAVLEKLTQSI